VAKVLLDEGVNVIKNLKELTTYWTPENGFDKVAAPDKQVWKNNTLSTVKTIQFYDQWSLYLHDALPIWQMLYVIPASIMKLLYSLSSSIEVLFEKIFVLFGLFNYLNDTSSWIGKFYFWGRYIGMAIFVALIIARITLSFIGGSFKYKEFFNNLILVSFALNVLPTALVAAGNMISYATTTLRTHSAEQKQTLSLVPIKGNVVDLFYLIDEDFDTNKLEYDPNSKYIRKDASELNDITDSNLQQTKFESFIGASTEEILNYYIYKDEDKKEKRTSSDKYYGVATLLTSSKQVGETRKDGTKQYIIAGIEVSNMFGLDFSVFSPVYPRYKVDYFAIFIQQIMLIALLAGLLISMVHTIFKVLLSSMVAPFVAYTSVDDSTKFMELLQTIFAGVAGIFFEIAIVHFSMWFLQNAQTVAIGKATIFSNLNGLSKALMMIILYIATFLGASQGSGAIKSWLGVTTGAKNGMMTALGAGFGAYQGAKFANNAVRGRKNPMTGKRQGGLVGATKKGVGLANRAGHLGAQGARKGLSMAGNGLGKAAGSAMNLHSGYKAYRNSGFTPQQAVEGVLSDRARVAGSNAVVGAKTKARKAARTVRTNAKSAYDKATAPISQGYNSTRHGLTQKKATPLGAHKREGNAIKVPKNTMNDYRKKIEQNKSKVTESGAKPVNTISYKKANLKENQGHQNSITDLPNVTGEVEEF
jgi:hypothetical protein